MSLQPWYKVVVPRQDLCEGRPLEGFLDSQAECTGQNPDTGEADPAPVWVHPPDLQEAATNTVLEQAELLAADWAT